MMENLCDFIKDELKEMDRKVASGGKLTASEIQYGDMLAHFKKNLLTADAMEESNSYGYRSYNDGYGMADRSMRGRRRDSIGRYTREGRYDGRTYDDGMISELRELMNEAPNDHVKQKFQRFINEMEQM